MKKKLMVLISILLLATTFMSCITIRKKSNEEDESKYIIYATTAMPKSLDLNETGIRENDLICSLFDGLVEINEDGTILPSIAKAWGCTQDGIEYTFVIDDKAKWSDGKKIKASDYVNFFKGILDNHKNLDFYKELYCIYGVREYIEGKIAFEKGVAISAPSDDKLKFRMNSKNDGFLKMLTEPRYRLRNLDDKLKNYSKEYSSILYTGAYRIEYVAEGDKVRVVPNENYNIRNQRLIQNLEFKLTQGDELGFAAFNTSKIDLLLNPPVASISKVKNNSGFSIYPSNSLVTLVFNEQNKIASDLEFRKGIWKALMWEVFDSDLVKNNFKEVALGDFVRREKPDKSLMTNSNITDNSKQKEINKKQANDIFEKLKVKSGKLNLIAVDNSESRILLTFIQKKLQENNGLKININFYNEQEIKNVIDSKEYTMYLKTYDVDSNNIISFLKEWNKGENTLGGFSDSSYSKVVGKLDSNSNKAELMQNIATAEGILKEKLPFIPLYFNNVVWCKSDRIKDISLDGNGNILFKDVEME
ncbi:peptide/nickel transport system substrate-binding protein [Clostridium cavendishii DSM 21758]|uniref:Peptide/nickel transport system substrate-binding protein n=1 Tax=Clostridium cavendishii DSM 21758 TaxID=1121302 RepID=A0A1M6LFB4_9CLOT|nr:ABC transporter substrate-binding protein [Clostridium cavendishii]SHJ69921.1 peptide/nickel transport system substrate-binding protein [Clostridium cavendishii DSM 21758]